MIRSRLTTKSQTTIPRPVRAALGLGPGDEVTYEIDGARVILRKAEEPRGEDPFAAFSEWDSDADREGYADL
jgi:antitoxin PrlF